jgi:phosphate transport system substrate-binding protein
MIRGNNSKKIKMLVIAIAVIASAVFLSGCLGDGDGKPKLIQTGSSTVLPLAMAWAEEFEEADISVSGGGSSHGINALLEGEADLGDASRLMKSKDYESVDCDGSLVNDDGTASAACNGVLPVKWVVAYDVLAVVVHNDNTWATQLTYDQLYSIFTDDNSSIYWDDVEGLEGAPHQEIEIHAPDEASGTYDFFFEEIIPKWGKDDQQANTRLDSGDGVYHPNADDNVILNALNIQQYAIGYFGYAYYKENTDKVQIVEIAKEGTDYQEASLTNVANYPLARPLHIYTNGIPEPDSILAQYMEYIFSDEGQAIVPEVGYVNLDLVDTNLISSQLARIG